MEPGTRHEARERALSLLYEAEMKAQSVSSVLGELAVAPDPFACALATEAEKHQSEVDDLIGSASVGWPIDRLATVDHLVLRLAVTELLDETGPPVAVIIDEAVELAKAYSTDESGRFVNGILSTLAGQLRADS